MTTATLYLLLPEIVLIAAAVAIYLGGAFLPARQMWRWVAGGAILVAAIALWCQHGPAEVGATLHFDELAWLIRWLALAFGVLLLLLASERSSDAIAEYIGLLLLVVPGLMLVGVAGDLVLLFVALELISIPTYVLLYLGRRDVASREATAKYFFLSVLSSAIALYGFSFLYGIAGSTDLSAVRSALTERSRCRRALPSSQSWPWPWFSAACASASPPCRSTFTPPTCIREPRIRTPRCYRLCPRRRDFW